MKIYDISMKITEDMMVYKNRDNKRPKIIQMATYEKNNYYESNININVHTGTHIDAPLHMIDGGSNMDIYSIEDFISKAKVLDFTSIKDCITESDLRKKDIEEGDFVLLKTKNSYDTKFNEEFIYLEKSGANYLAALKIKGVGIDALGIERNQPNHETHKILFNNKIMIVEGLALKEIKEGHYQFIVLPLKLNELEASLARAILIKE